MKRTILISALLIYGFVTITAQDSKVGISFNQNFSTFRFIDSEGVKDNLDYAIKFGYGFTYQMVFRNHLFLEGFLTYNNKGASSTLDQDKLDWSFHYVNTGLDFGYKFLIGRLAPQAGAGLYYGRLLKADQYIGSDYYNLMSSNEINKNDFGVNLFAGLEYEYSDNGSVFIRLNEALGLLQLESDEESTQKMFNRTISIQFGLLFSIR